VELGFKMASIKRVQKACEPYGLSISPRTGHLFAVFRPMTGGTISLFDPWDVVDPELAAMEWSVEEIFTDPESRVFPRIWKPS
jgi:hypothetical protein